MSSPTFVFLIIKPRKIAINIAAGTPNSEILNPRKTPTAIIWGKQDTVTPPNVAKEFNELLPDSNLYWIDRCGHAPMMEHPDKFNAILENWLETRNF